MDRDYTQLDRVWKGPAEILQRVGVGRYKVATEKGEKILHTVDLKPCLDPLDQLPPPPIIGTRLSRTWWNKISMLWKVYLRITWWALGKNDTGNGMLSIRGTISRSGNLCRLSCMMSRMHGQSTTNNMI